MTLPLGKLPADLLARLLAGAPIEDPRVIVGPGPGMDCAVIDLGEELLVCKTDPVTFVTDELGHYLVQVNVNDVATTGAVPRWLLVALLLPEGRATAPAVESMFGQVCRACRDFGISLVGGHTEITRGLDHPIAVGSLLGTVARESLITPRGAAPGDRLLLTKGVPIEGTSILARELPDRIREALGEETLGEARDFLYRPGISVFRDARVAIGAGRVTAMHDPTEGGLVAALCELAEASGRSLHVNLAAVPVPAVSARICSLLGIDPLRTIASGSLLLTAPPADAKKILRALHVEEIECVDIGEVREGPPSVFSGGHEELLCNPAQDELARLFSAENNANRPESLQNVPPLGERLRRRRE